MSRRTTAAALAATLLLANAARADEADPPLRADRRLALSVVGTSLLEAPTPLWGVQGGYAVTGRFALDLTIQTLGVDVFIGLMGARLYLSEARLSPYLFVRGGVSGQSFESASRSWLAP